MAHIDLADFLGDVPLVDGHNDLPWAIWDRAARDLGRLDVAAPQRNLHTDLPRLRAGQVGAQFWSVYVPCQLKGAEAVKAVLEQVDLVHQMCRRYDADLRLVTTAEQAVAAHRAGRVASLMGAEGGHCIDESLPVLRMLRALGVRYLTLTHGKNVGWADSATDVPEARGLTDFGREVVREMNRIGMLVDLSHVTTATMNAALDESSEPVLFTHSSARALVPSERNVPDDVLERLAVNGGVCMVTFVPAFVSTSVMEWYDEAFAAAASSGARSGTPDSARFWAQWEAANPQPRATLKQVADHIDHIRDVAGIAHVGIGGDFDGVGQMPEGLDDVARYPALFEELSRRHWTNDDLTALAGANALRVLRHADAKKCELTSADARAGK